MPHIRFQLPLVFCNHGQALFQFEPPPLVFFKLKHTGQIGIG